MNTGQTALPRRRREPTLDTSSVRHEHHAASVVGIGANEMLNTVVKPVVALVAQQALVYGKYVLWRRVDR